MESFESGTRPNRDIFELQSELQRARAEKRDIYEIARLLQMLKMRGAAISLEEGEWEAIEENLEKARKGESERPLEQGYEIARWLMIEKTLKPESELEFRDEDKRAIEDALQHYRGEANFKQMASLMQTSHVLGHELNLQNPTPLENQAIDHELRQLK